jgi:hypothetical protein
MGQSSSQQQQMFNRVNSFLDTPDGPSIAAAQLVEAQNKNFGNLIGAARGGRGGAGAQAQALRGAISEGGAIASDTANQLATLRAQEEDMRRNRQLSAMGLGGQMASDIRQGDLSYRGQDIAQLQSDQSTALGARGQNLSALQSDQSTALGARGQDLNAAMSDQSQQNAMAMANLQAAMQGRGQDLSALQGDQSAGTQLSLANLSAMLQQRGQDLTALQSDQGAQTQLALGNLSAQTTARGQDINALLGDQSTAAQIALGNLGAQTTARGQNLSALQSDQSSQLAMQQLLGNMGTTIRGQDLQTLTNDADRQLQAQQLAAQLQMGLTNSALTANGQGIEAQQGADRNSIAQQQLINQLIDSGMKLTPEQQALIATRSGLLGAAPALLPLLAA